MSLKNFSNSTAFFKDLPRICLKRVPTRRMVSSKVHAAHAKKESYWVQKTMKPVDKEQVRPQKSDVGSRAKPRLGFPSFSVPNRPDGIVPNFGNTRLDTRLYKPSKSLDRAFQSNWVDCAPRRKTIKHIQMIPPEIKRRVKTPRPYCPPDTPDQLSTETEGPESEGLKGTVEDRAVQKASKRPRTRYPSFSECTAAWKSASSDSLHPRSVCDVWRYYQNLYR
ncbi:PREDICTED: uncharacterized protein LOC108617280 [Drosophila arizonae]|uniref:Uncharacterized protein LOC108617280 n=1 Tax=Drosophila arizonae TaxID=7263 RepID=A0ABM1PMR5_DROAR|nr:PREDICTED: uncharacterized protein LOC108617280 [Drosophila arizonae]